MGIVLSHTTAKAVYQAAYTVAASVTEPINDVEILSSCPNKAMLNSAIDWLSTHNIQRDDSSPIEAMVFNRKNIRSFPGFRVHVSTKRFSSSRFVKLADEIFVSSIELCALQAATYLSFRELVEYYYELCGAYSLESETSTTYTERPPLTSTAKLKHFFKAVSDCSGLVLARKAINCVRNGCRSPMETAFVMMLTLPKNEGGLGIKGIETDYEVNIATIARSLTRRTKFYLDAYLKKSRTDIEYNGFQHDAEEDRAIDEERKNALAAMGIGIITVSRHSFMHSKPFVRVMEAIQRKEGIRPSRLPKNFHVKQEELRKFVLRRYIEERERLQEKIRKDHEERQRIEFEKALLEGVLDDPTINPAPEPTDDMQEIDLQIPVNYENSPSEPEGKVYGSRKKERE